MIERHKSNGWPVGPGRFVWARLPGPPLPFGPGYANELTFGPESHVGVGSVSERGMETNLFVRNVGYGKQPNPSICPNLKRSDKFLPELRPLDCQSTGAAEFLGRS